jgi:hypothetical protein
MSQARQPAPHRFYSRLTGVRLGLSVFVVLLSDALGFIQGEEPAVPVKAPGVQEVVGLLGTQRPVGVAGLVLVASEPAQDRRLPEGSMFLEDRVRSLLAAAQVVGLGRPHQAAATVSAAAASNAWPARPAEPEKPNVRDKNDPAVDRELLANVEDGAPVRNAEENYSEFEAYCYLLTRAHELSIAVLRKKARRDVTYAHMFEEPAKYRGEVVHVEGRLKRVRKFDAPRLVQKDGVPVLYEGWLFDKVYFANPICIVFTDKPDWLEVNERMDEQVQFDGYFFKKYRYETAEVEKGKDGRPRQVTRDAPLLIGHTVYREGGDASDESPSPLTGSTLVLWLIGLTVVTIGLVGGLAWWFRRGDRAVQSRLAAVRYPGFVEPPPEEGVPPSVG